MKNTFRNKKKRMSVKADIRKRNTIAFIAMMEELEAADKICQDDIREYREMKACGEEIDLDACIHMAVSNFEAERYQIMCKYIDRGLPADYAEAIALKYL